MRDTAPAARVRRSAARRACPVTGVRDAQMRVASEEAAQREHTAAARLLQAEAANEAREAELAAQQRAARDQEELVKALDGPEAKARGTEASGEVCSALPRVAYSMAASSVRQRWSPCLSEHCSR